MDGDKPTEQEPAAQEPTKTSVLEKANTTLDTANQTVKNAGSVLNTIKWASIAFITLIVFLILMKIYQIVAAPAAAVGDAVEGVSDTVKSSAEAVAEGTSGVINRLDIPTTDQRKLNRLSEAAFKTLSTMETSDPEGVKDRMFRAANLGGNDGRVCRMDLDFGTGAVPVFAAADNDAHATARSLGSTDDRFMRLIIQAGDDDVSISTFWDEEASNWMMKWKGTTLKKPASDEIAEARVFDALSAVPESCGG